MLTSYECMFKSLDFVCAVSDRGSPTCYQCCRGNGRVDYQGDVSVGVPSILLPPDKDDRLLSPLYRGCFLGRRSSEHRFSR